MAAPLGFAPRLHGVRGRHPAIGTQGIIGSDYWDRTSLDAGSKPAVVPDYQVASIGGNGWILTSLRGVATHCVVTPPRSRNWSVLKDLHPLLMV